MASFDPRQHPQSRNTCFGTPMIDRIAGIAAKLCQLADELPHHSEVALGVEPRPLNSNDVQAADEVRKLVDELAGLARDAKVQKDLHNLNRT